MTPQQLSADNGYQSGRNRQALEANRISGNPMVVGGALVISQGLFAQRQGESVFIVDAASRTRIEQLAKQTVMDKEIGLGNQVKDIFEEKRTGYHLYSSSVLPSRPVNWTQPGTAHSYMN